MAVLAGRQSAGATCGHAGRDSKGALDADSCKRRHSMHAATQQLRHNDAAAAITGAGASPLPMSRQTAPVLIQGITRGPHLPAQRLGRAPGRGDVVLPARRRRGGIGAYIGYSPYCVPQVDRRREVRDRQRGAEGHRADGLGLRHELRPRQRPAGAEACCCRRRLQLTKGLRKRALRAQRPAVQAASASALTLADRRLFWRAALFLWKMPLSATESMTLWPT